MRGDFSSVNTSGVIGPSANYISLSPISINLDKNAPTDKIKVAFSVINREGTLIDLEPAQPAKVTIRVEFVTPSGAKASFDSNISSNLLAGDANFSTNRYYVLSTAIKDLVKTAGFAWSQVNAVRVYSAVMVKPGADFVASDLFYVSMDAIRLDNVNSYNPLYGLTGYTVVKNLDARPIIKLPNTTSLIEFRLGIGIE